MYKQIKLLDHHIIAGEHAPEVFKTLFESGDYKNRKFFILTDTNTQQHILPQLQEYLPSAQDIFELSLPAGEVNKTAESAVRIWEFLAAHQADRSSVLVNLGGGMITDIGGFAAANYKRGISFINIPTSLMAMVDAAIGGKTAVNLSKLKNIAGRFVQPDSIYIYPRFLETLPEIELLSGYAEILKYALINDRELWEALKNKQPRDFDSLEDLIIFSVLIKAEIVEADPMEHNRRKILNFGHTIGHALETLMQRKEKSITHGEAIAAGMLAESYLSHIVNEMEKEQLENIRKTIRNIYPDISFEKTDIPELTEIMKNDKKNRSEKINCSLLRNIGECKYDQFVPEELLKDALKIYLHE